MRSINIYCGEINYTISYTDDKEKLLTQFDSFDEWFNKRVDWEKDKPKEYYQKEHKRIMQAKSLDDSEESKIKKSIDRIKSKIQSNDKTLYAYGVNKFYDGEKELLRINGFIRLEKSLAKTIYDSTLGIDRKEALKAMTFIIDNYLYSPCCNKEIIEQSTTKQVCYQYYCTYAVTLRTLWFASSLLYASTDYFDRLIGAPTTSNMDLVTLRGEPNLVTAILYTLLRFMCCLLFEKILQFAGEKMTNTKWFVLLLKCAPYVFPLQHKVIPGGGKVTSTFAVAATVCVLVDQSKTLPLVLADATRTIKYASELSGIQNDTYGKSLNYIPQYILNIDQGERLKGNDPRLTKEIGKDMIRMPEEQDICAVDSTTDLIRARSYAAVSKQKIFETIYLPKTFTEHNLRTPDDETYNVLIKNLIMRSSSALHKLGERLTRDEVGFDHSLYDMLSKENGFKTFGEQMRLEKILPLILQRRLSEPALTVVMKMPSSCFSMTQGNRWDLTPLWGKAIDQALSNTYYLYNASVLISSVVRSYLIDDSIVRKNTKEFLIKMKTRLADTNQQIQKNESYYKIFFSQFYTNAIIYFSKDNVFQGIDTVVVEVLSKSTATDKEKHLQALVLLDSEMRDFPETELGFTTEEDIVYHLKYWSIRSVYGQYTNDRLYNYFYETNMYDMDKSMLKITRASYKRSLWFAIEENLTCKNNHRTCTDQGEHKDIIYNDYDPNRKFSIRNIQEFVRKGRIIFGEEEVKNMLAEYSDCTQSKINSPLKAKWWWGLYTVNMFTYIQTTETLLKYMKDNPILSIGP